MVRIEAGTDFSRAMISVIRPIPLKRGLALPCRSNPKLMISLAVML